MSRGGVSGFFRGFLGFREGSCAFAVDDLFVEVRFALTGSQNGLRAVGAGVFGLGRVRAPAAGLFDLERFRPPAAADLLSFACAKESRQRKHTPEAAPSGHPALRVREAS